MTVNLLPLIAAGPQRIAFPQASPPLVAQALADAKERLGRYFPTVSWTTWRDMLRQLQLEVLVQGKAVTFDWSDLVRRFQSLASSLEWPAPAPSMKGQADGQLRAHR